MASAVEKSFRVLEEVSSAAGPVRLSALASSLGLQKSTVHRVLAELIELGYVEQDTVGLYRPTLKTWEVGAGVVADLPLKQAASTLLHELHQRTGETVSLVVRSGDDALYLDKIISPRPLRFTTRVGSRIPLPLPTGGRVILAHAADAAEVAERVATRDDLGVTIEPAALLRSLERIRRTGYAMSSAKLRVISIAAPVLDRRGVPAGALAVSAPADRLSCDRRSEAIDAVVGAANRLTDALGRHA